LNAAVAGALLPGCAMTTVPLAASLRYQGARLGTLTAFIMISPILSPETIVLTAAMLGPKFTIARIAISLAVTLALGLAVNWLERRHWTGFGVPAGEAAAGTGATASCGGCRCACDVTTGRRTLLKSFVRLLHPLWIYFVLGLLAVAILQMFVPPPVIARHGQGGFLAYVVAALAGIPLYVCEGGEVPLTYGLLKAGVGAGPAFTFLLGAVGTCLPTITMAPRIIGTAATALYVATWLVLAIGGGWLVGWLV